MVCSLEPNPENEMKIRQIAREFGNATVEFISFTPQHRDALPVDRYISLGAILDSSSQNMLILAWKNFFILIPT